MDAVAMTGSLLACAVMAGAAAFTATRLDAVSGRNGEADDYFWVAFGGAVAVVGAGVVAGSLGAAWLALVVGGVSSAVALTWFWRRHSRRARRIEDDARAAVWKELDGRRDAVLRRWADYDVDPAKAISYPGMHDPADPAGGQVVRALRAAGAERDAVGASPGDTVHTARYGDAVTRLEQVFEAAERKLTTSQERPIARHRASPVDLESLHSNRRTDADRR